MSCVKKRESYKSDTNILIFLCWLVYSVSYLGKVNYSANITGIIDFYNVTNAEAGLAPTFFFFAYGVGQVVNGFLCKKYNIKWMIFISLTVSAVINLIIAVSSNFAIIKWLWMINGFVLSILWPTLIKLLSESLPQKDLCRSSAIMGTTVACGTLAIYGLSSIYACFFNFNLSFYTAAFAVIVVAFFWMIFYKRTVNAAKSEKAKECIENENKTESTERVQQTKNEKKLLFISIYVLCFCAVGVNLIKDGLITWLPAILKEEYAVKDSISILLTVLLPIVAVFGNLFALNVHKKIPDYITHCGVVFAIMFIFMGIIIRCLTVRQMLIMLVGLIVINLLASSLNSLLTSIFPMFMREKLNSGLFAGVLNGFCYLGSTISSYGLGVIADNFGWNMIFWVLLGMCIITFLICSGYIFIKQHIKTEQA